MISKLGHFRGSIYLVLLAIIFSLLFLQATEAETYELSLSFSPNRSSPVPLAGQTVSGNIYVFVSPQTGMTQVRFYLDDPSMTGAPKQVENNPPHDFAGGSVSTANPYNTTQVGDGPHTITAAIDLSAGGTIIVSSTFAIANNTLTPTPTPSPTPTTAPSYDLQLSSSPNRSSPVPLAGQTVTGNIYVFVSPQTGVNQVRFFLDNPGMSGTPIKVENNAPWDFAGTASNGTANPYNSSQLTFGSHTITAAIDLSSGGTQVVSANFDVAVSAPDQVHLAWVDDPSTTLTIIWRTWDTSTPSMVEYRPAGEASWQSTLGALRTSGTTGTLHEVTLTSLTPSTSYEYRVRGDGSSWSPIFTTRTAPPPGPANFDAVYVADTGLIGRSDGLATGTEQVVEEIA